LSVKPEKDSLELLRQAVRDHTTKDVVLLLLGAFIAGLTGYISSLRIHKLEVEQREKEEAEFKNNVLRAIRTELEAISAVYDAGMGKVLKENEKSEILLIKLSITQDWFTVFNANAVHLGKIEKDISGRIVATYALGKALIEEFRINNKYVDEMAILDFQIMQREGELHLRKRKEILYGWMVFEKTRINAAEQALKGSMIKLFSMLDERGIK
jgi:hypothetical protein